MLWFESLIHDSIFELLLHIHGDSTYDWYYIISHLSRPRWMLTSYLPHRSSTSGNLSSSLTIWFIVLNLFVFDITVVISNEVRILIEEFKKIHYIIHLIMLLYMTIRLCKIVEILLNLTIIWDFEFVYW